jgi:hypothetical protein
MFRVVLLGFLVFSVSLVVMPTQVYAISLDDEEEDAEDVADLLDEAKKAGKSESFSKADALLKKAKMYGTGSSDVGKAQQYVSAKKKARDERLERERKERERLARLKREKEERARQARLARQRQNSYSSSSSSYGGGGSISLCIPSVPYKCCKTGECRAKSASGRYENVTVKLEKDFVGDCYTLSLYGGNGYGGGNTCSGANGGWSVSANGQSGYANGLGNAIAWLLRRM